EQRSGVLGAVERVGRGLVDRQRPRVGSDVRRLAGMDLLGLERPPRGTRLVRATIGRRRVVKCVFGAHGMFSWCDGPAGLGATHSATTAHAGPPPVFSGGPSQRTRACR